MGDLYELDMEGADYYAHLAVKTLAAEGHLRVVEIHDTAYTRRKAGGGVELVLEDGFLVAGHRYGLVLLEGDS